MDLPATLASDQQKRSTENMMNAWNMALCAGLLGLWLWLECHPTRVQRQHEAREHELDAYDWRNN